MSNIERFRANLMGYVNAQPEGQPVKFYLMHLNPDAKGQVDRFAVLYPDKDGTMTPVWGGFDGDEPTRKERDQWPPFMVYQRRPAHGPDRYPAFHFALRGGGYSKPQELAEALATFIQRPVIYCQLTGWASHWSNPFEPYRRAA